MNVSNEITYKIKYGIIPSNIISNEIQPTEDRLQKLEDGIQFFSKLEKSILSHGFRNPIVVNATKFGIVNRYGGSRLMIAQKHNMKIPCIIADFDDIFSDLIEIQYNDIKTFFIDKPKKVYLKPHGINVSGCEHSHLKDD